MKNRKFYILLLSSFLIFVFSCGKDQEPVNRIDLDGDFDFGIAERYSDEVKDRIPYLMNKILKEIPCDQVNYNYVIEVSDNTIEYDLSSVQLTGNCEDTIIQPMHYVALNDLQTKEYVLKIKISDVLNIEGKLNNKEDILSIDIPDQEGIDAIRKTVTKVKGNLVWGRLSITDNDHLPLINDFTDYLYDEYGKANVGDGYYTPFTIIDGYVTLNSSEYPPKTSWHKSYLIEIDNQSELNQFIEDIDFYRQQNYGKVHVEAYTWNGLSL